MKPDETLRCSFCHKGQDVVGKLISSPSDYPRAHICNECIAVCHTILEDDGKIPFSFGVPVWLNDVEPSPVVYNLAAFAEFSAAKMTKTDIARGETLFVGLNCFEAGQEHAAHAHAGQDKLYVVLVGAAEIQVGEESKVVYAGGGAFASSGVLHSIKNIGNERLVVLAVLAPPPGK